jgi:hypothetical protein
MSLTEHVSGIPTLSNRHLADLEAAYPKFAEAARQLRYLCEPANAPAIRRRNQRRMRVGLKPLEVAIPAAYHTAFWAVYEPPLHFPHPLFYIE